MNNTVEVDFAGHELGSPLFEQTVVTLWLIGIGISFIGFLVQSILFILIPQSRNFDEIIVFEMTIARIVYTVLEFYIIYYVENSSYLVGVIVYVIYMHSDVVMLCFMFIFTKNLYNKIVVVFPLLNYNLLVTSTVAWTAPVPVSCLGPILMVLNQYYCTIFWNVYAHVKFFICILNALVFTEIMRVAFKRNTFFRTAIIAFVLVSITSLQVLVTDLINHYYKHVQNRSLMLVFCVINSYQVLALSGILIILVKNKVNDSMIRLMTIKLNDLKPSFV